MIPQTAEQMAAMIFMMELNEWSSDISEKLCGKLAEDAFAAADVFFRARDKRQRGEQEVVDGPVCGLVTKKSRKQTPPKPMNESKGSYVPSPTQVPPPAPHDTRS